MLPLRSSLAAVVAASWLMATVSQAFAILVVLESPKSIPFSVRYPEPAREQVRTALTPIDGRFGGGHAMNAVSHLHYRGGTPALNDMLRGLVGCPKATVSVSFQMLDASGFDWKIIYNANFMEFQAVVNLNSQQIELDQLVIPAARCISDATVEPPVPRVAPESHVSSPHNNAPATLREFGTRRMGAAFGQSGGNKLGSFFAPFARAGLWLIRLGGSGTNRPASSNRVRSTMSGDIHRSRDSSSARITGCRLRPV
jgi:hypothetical protein